jgi:hypothetical protein
MKMLRKYLLAGMALALIAGPVLSISTAARADHDHDDDNDRDRIRYYIVRADDGSCKVRLSRRYETIGQYRSKAGAERALAVKRTIGEC